MTDTANVHFQKSNTTKKSRPAHRYGTLFVILPNNRADIKQTL